MRFFLIFFFFILSYAHNSPYSLQKFHSVLDGSKLQAPKSSFDPLYSRHYGDFKDFQNRYFYLQDHNYMVFEMCEYKHRSELRRKNSWKVNTNEPKILEAIVKLFPLNSKREFTFLQVHDDSTRDPHNNKPLLRIAWMRELHGKRDHLWAIIKVIERGEYKNRKMDLGKRSKGFTRIKIEIADNKLNIWRDNKKMIKNFDLSYWDRFYNYFKAGVYLQDEGCAKVLFKKLIIKDRDEN